jgi:hypothetical protein
VSHTPGQPDNGHTTGFYEGVTAEQERIIKLAENRICFDHKTSCEHASCYSLSDLIRLIKAEQ